MADADGDKAPKSTVFGGGTTDIHACGVVVVAVVVVVLGYLSLCCSYRMCRGVGVVVVVVLALTTTDREAEAGSNARRR